MSFLIYEFYSEKICNRDFDFGIDLETEFCNFAKCASNKPLIVFGAQMNSKHTNSYRTDIFIL